MIVSKASGNIIQQNFEIVKVYHGYFWNIINNCIKNIVVDCSDKVNVAIILV